jgi:hypothetical protein
MSRPTDDPIHRNLTFKTGNAAAGAFMRALDEYGAVADVGHMHMTRVEEWPSFVRELFVKLWKPADATRRIDLDITSEWVDIVHSALETQADWPALKVATQSHRYVAASAAVTLAHSVAKALALEKLEIDRVACEHPDRLRSRAAALDAEISDDVSPDDVSLARAAAELRMAEGRAATRRHTLRKRADKLPPEALTSAVKAALEQAKEQEYVVGLGRGFGLQNDEITGVEGEMRPELLKLILGDKRLQRIIELIGKMQEHAAAIGETQVTHGVQNLIGIELGDDPKRLVPTEVARLSDPLLANELYARMLDKNAQIWKLRGIRKKARGNIILCCDYSTSMDGTRIEWLRALAGAVLLTALRENRRVILVTYADTAASVTIEPRSPEHLALALKVLAAPVRGGTNAAAAVCEAGRHKPQGKGRPDMVFLSDGDFAHPGSEKYALSQEAARIVRDFRKAGGRIVMIGIECRVDEHADWTDERWHVRGDALDGSTGGEIVSAMFDAKE